MENNNRRLFLKQSITSATGLGLLPFFAIANFKDAPKIDTPKLDAELVRQFVAVCHGNFDKVKELYAKEPKLIFSSHDWGNGDFENGIEAAGHTGGKEIAHFLLDKGARINFFTLCMLGDFKTVKKMLKDFPYLLNAKGPHGFTPLHHANQGKEDAERVKKYLISLGATETKIPL
jgi:ankyrin repeat protein